MRAKAASQFVAAIIDNYQPVCQLQPTLNVRTNASTNEPRHDKTNKMSVRRAKTQISLGIRPVNSESSLCAQWVAKDPSFLHADSEDSDQTGRMPRLIWVFAGRTLILLVLSCRGSKGLGALLYQKQSDCTCLPIAEVWRPRRKSTWFTSSSPCLDYLHGGWFETNNTHSTAKLVHWTALGSLFEWLRLQNKTQEW